MPASSTSIGTAKSITKKKDKKHNLGFVIEGFVRFCYYNNKGENNFVSDQQKTVSRFLISLLTWELHNNHLAE
ncbi:MAG TPA: hypothetical protein VEY06_12650 [Flavisolibacter sp.]|nr:hypothetical protein [Flavisolibacter sp.]